MAVGDVDVAAAEAVAAEVGAGAFAVALDIADARQFAAFLDSAERRHGPLRVMVNNAGVDWVGPFHEDPTRSRDARSMSTCTARPLDPSWRSSGCFRAMSDINIASGAGRVPLPGSATYAATKHGVVGLTESLRMEYRGSGVAFTVVQPAEVETAMIDGLARPRAVPVVTPDDVAAAVLDAVRRKRFEVWVPRSQAASAKLAALLPRAARETLLRALGVTRIAGDADSNARRAYHRRAFGRG